jgi:hypothetical protein
VITPNRTFCYSEKAARLPATGGWLASKISEDTTCGSTNTPWVLKTQPGQTINITLHDYALRSAVSSQPAAPGHCQVYAIIKENASGRSKTICGGLLRTSHVFSTSLNEIEIRMMTGGTAERYFALEYNGNSTSLEEFLIVLRFIVIGCPDPVRPVGGWVERRGEEATIGCDKDDSAWTLRCSGNQWNGTTIKDCTKAPGKQLLTPNPNFVMMTY